MADSSLQFAADGKLLHGCRGQVLDVERSSVDDGASGNEPALSGISSAFFQSASPAEGGFPSKRISLDQNDCPLRRVAQP